MAMTTSHPRGRILFALREAFPGVDDAAFTLINSICCNGGQVSPGDVVSCLVGGEMQLGELLLTVGVDGLGTHSLIALWQRDGAMQADQAWAKFLVSDERVAKVSTADSVDTVFTHRMADDRKSCAIYLPPEVRATKRAVS